MPTDIVPFGRVDVQLVLLAGMKAFYVDRTFGGLWDAASAVSWGLAGGIVSGPLSTALGRAAESVRSVLGRCRPGGRVPGRASG